MSLIKKKNSVKKFTDKPITSKIEESLYDVMKQAAAPGLINLAAGVPSPLLLPIDPFSKCFQSGIEKDKGLMLAYHHPDGDYALREEIAKILQLRGIKATADRIITTTGCSQSINLMMKLLIKPGDIIACESPTYFGSLEIMKRYGARILEIPSDPATGIDVDLLESALKKFKPKALFLASAISNPSGATVPLENRKRLADLCRKNKVHIIEDDIYGFLQEPKPLPLIRSFDDGENVTVVSSFSKIVAPGLRCGYVLIGKKLYEKFGAEKCAADMHSCVVSEVALREFFLGGYFEPFLKGLKKTFSIRREIMVKAIETYFPEGSSVHIPEGGYMLWPSLPKRIDMDKLKADALKHKIAFGHGQLFFAKKQRQKNMRLNTAKASEEELVKGIEILGKLAKKYV
jgi:DNA-binding transcriptional MocR family regulator